MKAEFARYQRQMILPGVGEEGQARLRSARVLLIGCGALGCVNVDLLARAGVGRLDIVDRDVVELTNLQRQSLFEERHAADRVPKAEAARERVRAINSEVDVRGHVTDFAPSNAERLLAEISPGVMIDGTDNFETRYLINDLAVRSGVALVYAGVVGTRAMMMPILPGEGPCLRCVFRDPPAPGSQATCDTAGVFGPAATIIAGAQAGEALKILLGRPDLVQRSLLAFDLWEGRRTRMDLGAGDPECPCCGQRRFDFLNPREEPVVSLCGQGAVQVWPGLSGSIDLAALAVRLQAVGMFRRTDFVVFGELAEERGDAGERIGLTVFADGRAQIRGVRNPERARAIYARYIGA